jgi:hypothetical protein
MTDEKPQLDQFHEAARELECDDDTRFKERMERLLNRAKVPQGKSEAPHPVKKQKPVETSE